VGWKVLFLELYPLRHLWRAKGASPAKPDPPAAPDDEGTEPPASPPRWGASAAAGSRFKVNVYVRFKPSSEEDGSSEDLAKVTLPLHQRMALIRISHGLTSRREVLQVLMKEGSWFGPQWKAAREKKGRGKASSPPKAPAGGEGAAQTLHAGVHNLDPEFNRLVMVTPDVGMREFMFDGVFPTDIRQRDVYNKVARRLVMDCLNGFNTTAVVYGQTGAGKTFTMFGPDGLTSPGVAVAREQADSRGLVHRACSEMLFAVFYRRQMGIEANIGVSYVEVFGDTVTDLLRNGARCGQSKAASQRYVLTGAAQQEVNSLSEIMHFLRIGEDQKRRAATMMNERSSRAHSILIISLKQRDIRTGVEVNSKMFLADLGGSEQIKKSKVENVSRTASAESLARLADPPAPGGLAIQANPAPPTGAYSTGFEFGERMRETVYINLGLLALKKCIEALNNNSSYIPYQDSKLTMLLSTGLGGDSKTSVIICGNMDSAHAAETLNALRFGEKCSKVEQQARNNAAILASVLAKIDQDVAALEALIVQKERWVERTEQRVDALAEQGTMEAAIGGVETKKVYVVMGAEEERIRLEELLLRKAELTGSAFKLKTKSVAFGKESLYKSQFGDTYNPDDDLKTANVRFEDGADLTSVPLSVRARKSGRQGWRVSASDPTKIEQLAKKVDRQKLRYSGLSA
jgi:hypothetical protein